MGAVPRHAHRMQRKQTPDKTCRPWTSNEDLEEDTDHEYVSPLGDSVTHSVDACLVGAAANFLGTLQALSYIC